MYCHASSSLLDGGSHRHPLGMMHSVLGDVLRGFCESDWSEALCPQSAKADTKFFIRERRLIPVTRGVLQATSKGGDLVDLAGGEMVVLDHRPVKDILEKTWVALCVVANADGSAITFRAFRGSIMEKIALAARVDLVVFGNGDSLAARRSLRP